MIKFDKICPTCGCEMANTNTYCCLKCYDLGQLKELTRNKAKG